MLAAANSGRVNHWIVKPNQVRALLRKYVPHRMRAMVAEGERDWTPQARLRSAGATLLAARVRRSGKTGGRGALISPWAAARDFANALGVTMPDRASKSQRKNKSNRRRNTAR